MTTADRQWEFRTVMATPAATGQPDRHLDGAARPGRSPQPSATEVAAETDLTGARERRRRPGERRGRDPKRRAGSETWGTWRKPSLGADGSYAISVAMTTADRQWEFRTVMATTAGSLTGYSPIATLTVAARQPWEVTLNLSATEVAAGETVTYTGTVESAAGVPGSGAVVIQKRRAGSETWGTWRKPSLGADGSYAISVAMTTADRQWEFRTVMATTAGSLTGYSPIATLTVAARQPWEVTLNLSATEVAAGETVTYTGTVESAAGVPGSGAVVIQKRRAGSETWGTWRKPSLGADGSYAISVAMTTADRQWEFRTVMATTAGSLTGYSPIATLTVAARQ
ncbi:MAG: hypothetical protein R2826_01825 [Thermoleophilia bacterium]